MVGMDIMARICTFSYISSHPIEKVGDSPYAYPYPVNIEILHQNEYKFEQYPRERVYILSLLTNQ